METINIFNSILDTIKELLNISNDDTVFNIELIIHINSALSTLYELGVTKTPFRIKGEEETWDDLLGEETKLEDVKDYLYLRTKVVFDPPPSSYVLTCMKEMIKELEWRLNVKAEDAIEDGE